MHAFTQRAGRTDGHTHTSSRNTLADRWVINEAGSVTSCVRAAPALDAVGSATHETDAVKREN